MVAYGPDGTLYIASDQLNFPAGAVEPDFPKSGVGITFSTDHGKHFAPPQLTGSPEDRPWLKVDQQSGTVYTVSSGNYNSATGELDTPGSGTADRWLVAWNRDLSVKSGLRPIGGPDFSAEGGSTLTTRFGIVAATFVLSSGPVPASLAGLITDGTTTCTSTNPCLFFETSLDEGVTWQRHFISVPAGFDSNRASVAADPNRPGSYAVGVLNNANTQFHVFLTENYGNAWTGPSGITETAAGTDFKQWMDYGPTGVLGFMWKRSRPDLPPPPPTGSPPFDVYTAISCDGGRHWTAPIRVNSAPSPAAQSFVGGPPDDLGYITLDKEFVHLVWGDWRLQPTSLALKGAIADSWGGLQSFYGRVPFDLLSGKDDEGKDRECRGRQSPVDALTQRPSPKLMVRR